MPDMNISGTSCSINCWCSRWDTSDWGLTIETWLKKNDLQNLQDSVVPGATGELYKVLGRPTYYDKTWEGNNTLVITPSTDENSTLGNMRDSKVVYVKNMTSSPVPGGSGWINVKLECSISGEQLI